MRRFNLLLCLVLSVLAPCWATSYTVNQSAQWHTPTDFTPNGTPGFGDTITNAQYSLTCESGQTCNIGTVNSTAMTIGDGTHAASFINAGTFTIRGTGQLKGAAVNCAAGPTVNLQTGSTTYLDENGGSSASGFVLVNGFNSCVTFTIGTAGDVCTVSVGVYTCPTNVNSFNNGSANGVLLLDSDSGLGASVSNWHGVQIKNCGSSSAPCYQAEMYQVAYSWAWDWVVLNGDGYFGAGLYEGGSPLSTITLNRSMSLNRLANTDIYMNSLCASGSYSGGVLVTPACANPRTINNSLLRLAHYNASSGNPNDSFTSGATITNSVIDDLASQVTTLVAANIAGGSWSNVLLACDGTTCNEQGTALAYINAPIASRVYSLVYATVGIPVSVYVGSTASWGVNISLDHFIFDSQVTYGSSAPHCLYAGNGAVGNAYGYSISESYFTVVNNSSGYQSCQMSAWTSSLVHGPTFSLTHMLSAGGPNTAQSAIFYVGENNGVAATAPIITAYKYNIFYDSVARVNPIMFGSVTQSMQPANVAVPTGIDYNLNYNFLPANNSGFTTACGSCTNGGGPYAIPMTGSTPGPHDLPSASPGLLNPNSCNAYTWAQRRGQAGSGAGVLQVFRNDGPDLIGADLAALQWYINLCNKPVTNMTPISAAPDGTSIGPSQPRMAFGAALGLMPVVQ